MKRYKIKNWITKNGRHIPIGYSNRRSSRWNPTPLRMVEETRDQVKKLRMEAERRAVNNILREVIGTLSLPIFHFFSPVFAMLADIFLFGQDRIKEEIIISKIDSIQKNLETIEKTLGNNENPPAEVEQVTAVTNKVRIALSHDSRDNRTYVRNVYRTFFAARAYAIIEGEYTNRLYVHEIVLDPREIRERVDRKIDLIIDCLLGKLEDRKETVIESDRENLVKMLLEECGNDFL